jgi:FtsZ-binding cell division protein ZapB
MVTVEQIRILENRIAKACDLITVLRRENTTLKRAVDSSQAKMQELERFINQFKSEQAAIESGIINALRKLDELEDDLSENPHMESPKKEAGETPPRDQSVDIPEEEKGIAIASDEKAANDSKDDSGELDSEAELDIF